MFEAKQEADWTQTSHLLAGLYNIPPAVQGIVGKRPGKQRSAEEFMPSHLKNKVQWKDSEPPRVPLTILKTLWVDREQTQHVRIPEGYHRR